MGLVRVTPPAGKAVATEELRRWCRIDPDVTADDDLLDSLAGVAAELICKAWGVQLLDAVWRLSLDSLGAEVRLPVGPVSAAGPVLYADAGGEWRTLDSSAWELDATGPVAVVRPKWGVCWPPVRCHPGSVSVTFTAGYGSAEDVPGPLATAVKLAVAHWYENRGDAAGPDLPPAAVRLLSAWWPGEYV